MSWAIDLVAALGGCLLVGGVFLQFDTACALMVSGVLLIAFALKAARVHEGTDVSDSE